MASFGPIDPDKKSETFGYITTTPKKGWSNFNIIGILKKKLNIKNIAFDTDVNAACLGEVLFGNAKDIKNSLYQQEQQDKLLYLQKLHYNYYVMFQ